jgi:hypothetical protein
LINRLRILYDLLKNEVNTSQKFKSCNEGDYLDVLSLKNFKFVCLEDPYSYLDLEEIMLDFIDANGLNSSSCSSSSSSYFSSSMTPFNLTPAVAESVFQLFANRVFYCLRDIDGGGDYNVINQRRKLPIFCPFTNDSYNTFIDSSSNPIVVSQNLFVSHLLFILFNFV